MLPGDRRRQGATTTPRRRSVVENATLMCRWDQRGDGDVIMMYKGSDMKVPYWMLGLALSACSDATDPSGPPLIGTWCASTATTVTRSGSDATVRSYTNTTRYEDRARPSDGVVVRYEIRGCDERTCIVQGGASLSDQQLRSMCSV